jgi:hypothetical protein
LGSRIVCVFEEISFSLTLLGYALHLKLIADDLRFFLFFLLLLLVTGRFFFLLVQQLLHSNHLAHRETDLVAKALTLFTTSLDGGLVIVDFLHGEGGTLRGSHSKPLRVRSGYFRKESIR